MSAIHSFLPDPRHCEVQRIFVNARPDVAWRAARHFDASEIPWIRLLFDIRDLPNVVSGRPPATEDRRIGVDQIAATNKGFKLLHEQPGQEVVVGAIGKFWRLVMPFAEKVRPEEFEAFDEAGWGKLAWAIRVEPYREGSTISFELRMTATDEASWKKFHRYYSVIAIGSRPIRQALMTQMESELGKMKFPDDDEISFPGDEIIMDTAYQLTYHKIIEAPVAIVWRYLMQLGCDRAGWYSIDALDNGGRPSTDHLVAGWETRRVGERVSATPEQDDFFEIYALEPEHYYVMGGEAERLGGPFRTSWAFILEPVGEDATYLVSRARMSAAPAWSEWLMGKVVYPPVHGLMSGVQLKTIKRYAERDARRSVAVGELA